MEILFTIIALGFWVGGAYAFGGKEVAWGMCCCIAGLLVICFLCQGHG
jgi:hypothetical protein